MINAEELMEMDLECCGKKMQKDFFNPPNMEVDQVGFSCRTCKKNVSITIDYAPQIE